MSVENLLKNIRKKTGSSSFKDSKYGKVNEFIDTGCYALNRIMTGDIYKGIPTGKVVIFAGDSQSGKTYLAANVIKNALEKNNFDHIFYFDAEGGALTDLFEGLECDTSKIEHIVIENVEDATVKIFNVLKNIDEANDENLKFMCILDSLGGLIENKLYTDAEKGKQVAQMGGRAKKCNDLMKGLTIPCLKNQIPFLIINHVYDDPSALFASKIKNQSGGKGAQFMCRIGLQFNKSFKKPEDEGYEGFYGGNLISFFSYKNSFAKPFYEAQMYLDFSTGPRKYDGLIEPAIKYGLVEHEKGSRFYKVKGIEKKVFLKDLLINDELWSNILEEFNEKSKEELKYSRKEEIEDGESFVNE